MTNKAITLTLDKAARRVVSNGLNREWDHLAKLMSDISVKITNEKNPDEHASLTARYTNYLNQQLKVEEVQAILDNV
jgi:hypothetical protein